MKAAVCRTFGAPLQIEDITIASPGPNDILVDTKACAICHSDISYADGSWGGTLPAVYGHEAAGIVRKTGANVTGIKEGDHVVVTLIRSCGDCHYCNAGSLVMCEEVFPQQINSPLKDSAGNPLEQAMATGAFAEQVCVHQSQVVVVPKEIPFASASLLACGVITGYGAVKNTANIKPGVTVAVIGCGGVGLNAVQGAALNQAGTVIAIDLEESKLEAAKSFGATHTINPANENVAERVRSLTANRGVDFVFVTVGAKAAFAGAFDLITRNGAIVIVGMPPTGVVSEYDPGTMAAWNQKILGSKMGETVIARDIPALVKLYQQGKLKLDELVTGIYPLDQINLAIAKVKSGEALRNVIVFD